MQATIKQVIQNEKDIDVVVEYNNGKETVSKTHKYSATNLQSKEQVLDMIKGELQVIGTFNEVVEDLKTEIDRPIELSLAEVGVVDG